MSEMMWRVLPFPAFDKSIDRENIRSENWFNLDDFLTNGSSGVSVARAAGDAVQGIDEGDLVVYDMKLTPEIGDHVLDTARQIMEYDGGSVFGVVTCVIKPQASHKRQRQD